MQALLRRKETQITLKVLAGGCTLYFLYQLYRHLTHHSRPVSVVTTSFEEMDDFEKNPLSCIDKVEEHTPYEALIEDPNQRGLVKKTVEYLGHVRKINYKIILSLMKGNTYQGVVNISFILESIPGEPFFVNYNGLGIKFLMINNRIVPREEVVYRDHKIAIPKNYLREKSRNSIEIIFENFYSFLNQGLSSYFMVDQHQKYSLRQQVIYSVNGYYDVERIIPCLNCFNQCKAQVQVLHPDTFDVFSNTSKSLERLCSINEYQTYPFLFDMASAAVNRNFKINESAISNSSVIAMGESTASHASANWMQRKKANTHFYRQKLPSIHNLFIFSSPMVEIQPRTHPNAVESDLLIRYFCKPSEVHALTPNVDKLHTYILDVFHRLSYQHIKDYLNKIDILLIGDKQIEGHFAPGVIVLCQESLKERQIEVRCLYLLARGLLGLLQLERGHNVVTVRQILSLNTSTFHHFEEFRNYLFVKNQKCQRLKALLNDKSKGQYLSEYEGYLLKYFSKQMKFVVQDEQIDNKVSYQLTNIIDSLSQKPSEVFWQKFLASFNFLSPLIHGPLVKLGLRTLGAPKTSALLGQLRHSLQHSKYVLFFYTDQQISDELPSFLRMQNYGLEERLTRIKVKQKFKDYITEKYEKYLPIRSNHTEAESLYEQFKQFNENKNFHHVSVLKTELKRVTCFGDKFIAPFRAEISCSVAGWRLLGQVKIYPRQDNFYRLIATLEGLPV